MQILHSGSHVPLNCPICKKFYNQKRNLVTHLRKHHFGGLHKTKGDKKVKKEIEELLKKGIVSNYILSSKRKSIM